MVESVWIKHLPADPCWWLAVDFKMVWYYTSELKVSAAKMCLFEHNCSLALSAYFLFGFYMFGKFLNKVSTNKIDFLFLFKGCILCHAICNHHYPLYFFAQCCTVLRSLLSEYLGNGQIRNRSAIDSLHVQVWVKSISAASLFSWNVSCQCCVGRGEGRLEQKERDHNVSKQNLDPQHWSVDVSNAWQKLGPLMLVLRTFR